MAAGRQGGAIAGASGDDAIGLRRSERLRPFWKISLAYLAVSVGFLLTLIVGRWLPAPGSLTSSPITGLALGKLFDVVPLVLPLSLIHI